MSTIDERIVSMVFENAKFEAGIAQTLASLTKLDDSLKKAGKGTSLGSDIEKSASKVTLQGPMSALDKLRSRLSGSGQGAAEGMSQIEAAGNKVQLEQPIRALDNVQSKVGQVGRGAAEGFSEIETASGKVSLQGLNAAMDSVTAKFSVLQGAATVALGNITSQAAMKGAAFGKSFALGPLQQGFGEYQTNLQSIQTILANTEGQKVSGLDNVNKSLGELNTYSDQTIYNFSEMAKNIGTFTAAGVDLPRATQSIKGIANLAALSGSNSQQASTAMYQLSQAISAGRVGLQDWNSVVNAGMGGAVFQKSLMRTAENMGALEKGAVKIDKATGKATVNGESFRNSIMAKPGEESWLSSDVLTETLKQMTGDMSDAQLKAQGFTAEQIKAIQRQAQTAKAAATEVKTLPQVWDVARETIGSGWAQSAQLIFGNFKESKKTFTELSNAVNGVINNLSKARNHVLKVWKDLGGRNQLIEGIKAGLHVVETLIHVVNQAFRSIFPKKTGKDLFEMTKGFADLMKRLQPTYGTIKNLRSTFAGLFAVLHIGFAIVKGVAGVIGDLLGVVGHGSGSFLNFTGSVGEFLVSIDKALTKGGLLAKVFDSISSVLIKPMQLIGKLTHGISSLFGGFDSSGAGKLSDGLHGVTMAITPMDKALMRLRDAWRGFVGMLREAKELVSPWLDKIGTEMSRIGEVIGQAFKGGNFDKTMTILQTGFIGGLFIVIKRAITGSVTELGGVVKNFNGVFGALTNHLQAMQQKVKAQMILTIAAAVGILAAAAFVMAKIPAKDLTKAMGAMAVGLGELAGAMKLITSGLGKTGVAMVPLVAASMVLMATSLVILAGAAKIFATMSWEELAKGLIGIAGGLGAIGVGMKLLGPGTIVQAPAILVLAVALNALALAVKLFASMKWEDLARGIAGVFGALVAIAIPMAAIGPSITLAAPGILLIAVAMNALAGAIAIFGNMDMGTLAKGIGAVAASLILIGIGVAAIPPTVALQAVGLTVLALALQGIAVAVAMFAGIGIGGLVKGLIGMGGALVILAAGLIAMEGSLPGAAALTVAAAGIALLAPALGFLGALKWSTIFKGLVAMAAGLALLAVAGTFAGPGIAALGTALLPLAGVLVVSAAAVMLFAKALDIMGGAGSKGIAVMVAAITAFVLLLPKWIITLIKGFVEIVDEAAKVAPRALEAIGKMLDMIIEFVIKSAPRLALAISVLLAQFVKVINNNSPTIVNAGWKLLTTFLDGIAKNIVNVTTQVTNIVTRFLTAMAEKAPDLLNAGARFLGAWLTGIGNRIGGLAAKGVEIVAKFLGGIASKIQDVVNAGSRIITNVILGLAQHQGNLVTAGVSAILHILAGLGTNARRLIDKGIEVAGRFVRGVAHGLIKLADTGASAIIGFLNGMAEVIRNRAPEIGKAGNNLARAILQGLVEGLREFAPGPFKMLEFIARKLPKPLKKILGIASPSKVFHELGMYTMQGLANGLESGGIDAESRMDGAGNRVMQAAQKTMGNIPGLLDGIMDSDPVISPVLDLSQVKKDAGQIGDITSVAPVKASVSIGQAASISQEKATTDQARAEMAAAASRPSVEFKQYNTSPESLSETEIYRRTNNQLSRIRKEIGLDPFPVILESGAGT